MRPGLLLMVGLIALAAVGPLPAQQDTSQHPKYIEIISKEARTQIEDGRPVKRIYVTFAITPEGKEFMKDGSEYWAIIKEEGTEVKRIKLSSTTKKTRDLSAILAVDTSGSMSEATKESTRMEQARKASNVFFGKLPARVEAGLILFDHAVQKAIRPTTNRQEVINEINAAKPGGGTAYIDTALRAIDMLRGIKGRDKAIILMTDGIDLNSKVRDIDPVIQQANAEGIKIFTVGIGEPGKKQNVTSVLALDMSGSMNLPVDERASVSKLKSLMNSANRFVEIMPDSKDALIRSSVVLFSDTVNYPGAGDAYAFTKEKSTLSGVINRLLPPEEGKAKAEDPDRIPARGETALIDATYDAIALLEAENPTGKKVVVGLTDGIDNSSRHRVEEVIDRAKKAGIALFMLGFGKKGELDDAVMKRMAEATGGKYYEASNEKDLVQIFESLSVKIHDDGIDEGTLRKLADETGGKYYAAKDVDQLQFILEDVTIVLGADTISTSFPSLYQKIEGIDRPVTVDLAQISLSGNGVEIVQTEKAVIQGRGLIIAQMSPTVYLGLLLVLGALLALPAGLKRMSGSARK